MVGRVVVPDLLPKSSKSGIRQKSSALCSVTCLIQRQEFEEFQGGEKPHSLDLGSASAV